MKTRRWLLGALLLAACGQVPPAPQQNGPSYQPATNLPELPVSGAYVPGQLIVGYRDEASLQHAAQRAGATVTLRLPDLHAALLTLGELSVGQALYALHGLPGVAYAQPNVQRQRPLQHLRPVSGLSAQAITVNPDPARVPYFPQQWALKNTAPEGLSVQGAWDTLKGAGYGVGSYPDGGQTKPVTLAFFADPLPPTPDLQGQVVPGLDVGAWLGCSVPGSSKPDPQAQNLVNGACTPPNVLDLATIGAIRPNLQPGVNYATSTNTSGEASLDASNLVANGAGVLGVAYGAQVMPMAVFGGDGGAFSGDLVYAVSILWAVQHGATILNNSLGGATASPVVAAAVNYALSRGALVVAASGDNGDSLVSNPANVPGVLAVTSTGPGGHLSADSQVSPYVRFGAPGDNIVISAALGYAPCTDAASCPLGLTPTPGYLYSGGTSSSAPYTAGILALMQAAHHRKFGAFMSPGAAEDLLYATATPAPAGTQAYTNFRIPNAQKAVQAVLALGSAAPNTRGAATVTVTGGSGVPMAQADVFLKNAQHTYAAKTGYAVGVAGSFDERDGTATFLNVAPGSYAVLVGGPETFVDGAYLGTLNPADRLTATGTVTVTAGGSAAVAVALPKTSIAVQAVSTSPRLHLAVWEPNSSGYLIADRDRAAYGTFQPAGPSSGERYTLNDAYLPGPYLIGLYTGDLASGEQASVQLTVTENGKTSTASLGPFTRGQTLPTSGGVAGFVRLLPGMTALSK